MKRYRMIGFIVVVLFGRIAVDLVAEEAGKTDKETFVSTKEGFYASADEAQKYMDQTIADHLKYTQEKIVVVVMNYHFGAATKQELANLIAKVKADGFSQLDPSYIDEWEHVEPGQPRFWWIPGKKLKPDGAFLMSEVKKYQSLADSFKIHFNGITADARQEE